MGDDVTSQARDKGLEMKKDIRCPMLTSTNYTVWSIRMKVMLRLYEVWDTIEPGNIDLKKNNTAIALIFQSIPEALILQIGEHDTSKTIWDAIKSRNLGADRVREARLQTLMSEFDKLKMTDADTVDDYAGKLSGLASKSAALGKVMDVPKLVKKFLDGLPTNKFIHIVASLEQLLDLNSASFEEVVGRIKTFEERIKQETQDEDQSKLMFVKNDTQGRGEHNGYRGRGRGYGSRGRCRGRFSSHNEGGEASEKTKKDYSKVQCWRCDKMGHFASVCPTRPTQDQEANITETQEADALYMHEVAFLNEERVFPKRFDVSDGNTSIWHLDNGASNHMTGNREFFSSLDESIKGMVKFGDGSNVEIIGRGSITFVGKTGERRALKDIYYIPSLKHNIISLGQATEKGCEVNMKGDLLMLKDPEGRLLVQVSRSPNRLY